MMIFCIAFDFLDFFIGLSIYKSIISYSLPNLLDAPRDIVVVSDLI
jgi:hypothetical protein